MKGSILRILLLLTLIECDLIGQNTTDFIVVDQFGYLPGARKIAVIRDPQTGFDASESFSPGNEYALINAADDSEVFTSGISIWKNGMTDDSSGDKVWWFDFTEVTEIGSYYVLDKQHNLRSFEFQISPSVYNEPLKHAVRTFFYQRAGYAKEAAYAGREWADAASHVGPNQDLECHLFSSPNDPSNERDVSGGWYDAGDYNKYTSWTANYVVEMMKAYMEAPDAWGDDYNIPESGNGIPDLLDEAKWGIDHLIRLQEEDGGVLCIVDMAHASPPSAATERSLYGPSTTSASLNTAAALAAASVVFKSIGNEEYALQLESAAIAAWDWAVANPAVLFRNNDSAYNSEGIGAGQQEEDDYQRMMTKLEAAAFLFDLTKDTEYRSFIDNNYMTAHLFEWSYAYPFEASNQEALLYYAGIPEATASVATDIKDKYSSAMNGGSENFPAFYNDDDPYRAHLNSYTWGSNAVKSHKGNMFMNVVSFDLDPSKNDEAYEAGLTYVNYIHGLNPLNMVYLSNMYRYGAENCVNEFYHTWFQDGSTKWDRVGESTYGPAPGFLVGGPNPSYDWDSCCPDGCGSSGNNAVCNSEELTPPWNQPDQKSYKDFNTSWPLNSWSVSENSCGYQVAYIRLLSKFVNLAYDCNGVENGTAAIDVCGKCAGGNTGIEPVTDPAECEFDVGMGILDDFKKYFEIYPNPANESLYIASLNKGEFQMDIYDLSGKKMLQGRINGGIELDIESWHPGTYLVNVTNDEGHFNARFVRSEN